MRFTKEFKLECVQKYKNGKPIKDPGGCKHKTFLDTVRRWVRIYDSVGEVGLEHRFKMKTWQDKLALIQRVMDGESLQRVSIDNAIEVSLLSKWFKIYQESGIDGLKLDKRGRPIKMANKPKTSNETKTKEELEKELEYLRAENEYLKKLNALVRKRKDRQPKKK